MRRENKLHEADLLFCELNTVGLSKAIDEVTNTNKNKHYSHVGIIINKNNKPGVFHSTPQRGVYWQPLRNFIAEYSLGNRKIDVYRLNIVPELFINDVLDKIWEFEGMKYNQTYEIDADGMYCSQLIYEVFKDSEIFSLEPMTFKVSGTNRYLPYWIEYYKNLGCEIPEGMPGCNPNGLAISPDISFKFSLNNETDLSIFEDSLL